MAQQRAVRAGFDFDFLFYRDGEVVVAHCLQTDTAAFGKTVAAARRALRAALELEIVAAIEEGDLPRVFARPAPEALWRQIEDSVTRQYRKGSLKINKQPYKTRLKSHLLAGVE